MIWSASPGDPSAHLDTAPDHDRWIVLLPFVPGAKSV